MTAAPPAVSAAQDGAAGSRAPDALDGPDALHALRHWRLRPGVTASTLTEGLHLRGWSSSVTLEGSPALPALWRMVEEALRQGGAAELADRAGAGTPLRAALCTLIGQLHAHGMLVEDAAPAEGAPAGEWLLTVADHPARAAAALAGSRVEVRAGDPDAPLASAVVRALARAGITAARAGSRTGGAGRVLVRATRADGIEWAVGAAVGPGGAFVTPAGAPERAGADTAALAERLGLGGEPGPAAPPGPELTALVAGAAVQRLLCAVAGLPDPGSGDADGPRSGPPRLPSVLVAGERPLRSAYHPWPQGAAEPAAPPPGTLAEALAGVAALGDERLGVVAPPLTGTLPQLPVALAGCAAPGGGRLTAGAARADLARLDAVCRAAELRCGGRGVVVGAGPGHALGRALRRAALRLPAPGAGAAPWDPYGSGHPQARHWWRVLTRRLGVRARLSVTPLDAHGTAYRAEVRASGPPGRLLGRAVEATAGDAAAFAALAALVRVQASALDPAPRHTTSPGGELCPLAAAGADPAPWEDESWTAGWWAGTAAREAGLHAGLRALTGLRARPWEPAGPGARAVVTALRGCGFAVLAGHDEPGTDPEGGSR
ncbi:hypothetical protein ACFY7H_22910 [Streptomyces sp. NPDC012794]|uniref:hypothetical protein n=1 Tax=Streptomyces sp. NPDC012794 TaxID=3364850 RepID=UPI003687C51C